MSAAAARRRKQLAARQTGDAVAAKLTKLLESADDEPTAYEALQLAQSQVRKHVHAGKFDEGANLAYSSALVLLQKSRVSVASQLLNLLAEVLRETHTEANEKWIDKISELHASHSTAIKGSPDGAEKDRLLRLERDFLRRTVAWSSELGKVRFGHQRLHELLGAISWELPEAEEEDQHSLRADAVQHMALAEKPDTIVQWLKTLPAPTDEQTAMGHKCLSADRDTLLTRAVLLFLAVENLRDANTLIKGFINEVEDRDLDGLMTSYLKKDDGKTCAHVVFCSMVLKICERDARTGPLFTWLVKTFKKELDIMPKAPIILSYVTKIGRVYFDIQPPPSMMSMMENMMQMMGGGGGMNPAMMQAAMAQAGAL